MAEMLRPMSTGELMDRTLVLYKKNFKLFVGIASVGPASYLLFQLLTISSASVQAGAANRVSSFSAASLGFGFFAGGLIMLAGMAIAHGATVRAVAAVHLGLPIRIWEAYKSLKGKIWRVIGVFVCMGLLAGLVIIGASVLITIAILAIRALFIGNRGPQAAAFAVFLVFVPLVVVGISAMVVWVRYALAIACCVVEDLGVVKSIKRSAVLSKGSRFRIFLIYLVFVILAALLGAAFSGLALGVGTLIPVVTVRLIMVYLASFIAGTLTGPLATIGIALVYYDERVRKEAFDLQLMMSSLDPPAPSPAAAVPVQP
ncbi:MAG: hypothetical protein LAO30_21090 [Acidobacteriia bacterium]|nr:hypothetical protein [Terriglobia bacterium]